MKVCCETGKEVEGIDKLGCTSSDHCQGMMELVEYSQEIGLYEPDDGPLTDEQIEAIRKASSATDVPRENFNKRLFE